MRGYPSEFAARALRVHEFLHDIPLEDVWELRLAGGGAGRTIKELQSVLSAGLKSAPRVVIFLFELRRRIGSLLGWDKPQGARNDESFVQRLTPADRTQTLVAPGTANGDFKILYQFACEQLEEVHNATVHAFLSLSLQPAPYGYLGYLAVYVQPVHRLTGLYMAAIAPFRRWIVYPALIRSVESGWAARFGSENLQPVL